MDARFETSNVTMISKQSSSTLIQVILITTIAFHALLVAVNWKQIKNSSYCFHSFYGGAQLVANGEGNHLYDPGAQHSFQKQFPVRSQRPILYYHPPFEIAFYLPLTVF